ncbi:hypothetical protein [Cognaticolwellia mytili]|uniref:hypothetical protein n=1 Tax=Cognaticolwellia mytili TaxID=1888913 RepID=UPI001301A690|nr:hypothetical protein [Cognaticolwellia mytili]
MSNIDKKSATKAVAKDEKPALSKPEQAAVDAANTQTKNDGSHIEAERKKRLAEIQENK